MLLFIVRGERERLEEGVRPAARPGQPRGTRSGSAEISLQISDESHTLELNLRKHAYTQKRKRANERERSRQINVHIHTHTHSLIYLSSEQEGERETHANRCIESIIFNAPHMQ